MKSLSLESIHSNFNKQILLAESYSNCNGLSFIIKSCRLMPVEYPYAKNIILYKHWVDEFGNSLKITKNKKIDIIYNDLSLDKNNIPCSDLYYGLSIDKVYKISKLAYICAGIDEDSLEERFYVSFLGLDNHFRTYFFDGEWQQISTLHLGITNLKLIVSKVDIKYYLEFNNLKNMRYSCSRANQWLTVLPISQACIDSMSKNYSNLTIFSQQKVTI